MNKEITEMTPFVFEDGGIYYFQIMKRGTSNIYHDIFVYEKKSFTKKNWFRKKTIEKFVQVGGSEMIDVNFSMDIIKDAIKKIIRSTKPRKIDWWDGFVGNVPDDLKKAFIRASKIDDILD
jgi:hypothetical protein